jgi:hypothetical protein
MIRCFSAHGHGHHETVTHNDDDDDEPYISTRNHNATEAVYIEENVVIPGFVDTLEWVLDSPPNVHQFEEPPVSLFFIVFYNSHCQFFRLSSRLIIWRT